MRWKTWVLVACSVLLPIVVVDLILLAIEGPVRVVENFYEPASGYGYRMRPGLEFVFANPYHGYSATVRTNAFGLRDDPIAVPKPAGAFRVLLLGDSITAGLEVEKDQTFEAVCERHLAAHGNVEVINAGVRGYNLDNILGFLRAEGSRLQPDLVVYTFVDNDLTAETTYAPEVTDASRGFSLAGLIGRVASYSHLTYRAEILRQMIVLRRQRDRTAEDPRKVQVPGGLYELFRNPNYQMAHYRVTAARIAQLADSARQLGAVFLLVGAPHHAEIDPQAQAWWERYLGSEQTRFDFDGVRRYLEWVARTAGIERLDAVPEFRQQLGTTGFFWFHKDTHLNRRGHALLGEQLGAAIARLPAFETWAAAD